MKKFIFNFLFGIFILNSNYSSLKASQMYEESILNGTTYCFGKSLWDNETHTSACYGISTNNPADNSLELGIAVFGGFLATYAIEPSYRHIGKPLAIWTYNLTSSITRNIYEKTCFLWPIMPKFHRYSQEKMNDLEDIFGFSLNSYWIKRLNKIDTIMSEIEWEKQPITYREQDTGNVENNNFLKIKYLLGYNYTGYVNKFCQLLLIIGNYDKTPKKNLYRVHKSLDNKNTLSIMNEKFEVDMTKIINFINIDDNIINIEEKLENKKNTLANKEINKSSSPKKIIVGLMRK